MPQANADRTMDLRSGGYIKEVTFPMCLSISIGFCVMFEGMYGILCVSCRILGGSIGIFVD